jgi:peroxiredoxin
MIVLFALSVALAMNLFLTLRLVAIRRLEFGSMQRHFTVPIGVPIPKFQGRVPVDGRWISSKELIGQAVVLVFLSPVCEKCLGRIPELRQISPGARRLGISFWVIGVESPRRLSKVLKDSDLLGRQLLLDSNTRRLLNPQSAAPFYLFIDDRGNAQASDLVGDENWSLFADQLREALPGAEGWG